MLTLPSGSRFDGHAVPPCAASDQQLQLQGPAACPAASQVGGGTIQVMLGSPLDPETTDVTIFNAGTGTIEVLTAPGSGRTLAIDRGTFTAPNQLTNHPPAAPGGPPDYRAAVSEADLSYDRIQAPKGGAFITAPASCPRSRVWTSRVAYSTDDGKSYTATATTPCERRRTRGRALRRGH